MKILVAGGAGYVGSCCTEYLLDHGHAVIVLDSLERGHRDAIDARAEFVHADLADADALARMLAANRIDGMIHFAAFIEVSESMAAPGRFFRNNVGGGLTLLEAAVRHGIGKIVFSSTAAVYGIPERVPITESAATLPINPYGESKLMFERILHWYHAAHGLPYVALRYFNAAGATRVHGEDHRPETHLIPLVLDCAAGRRGDVTIFGTDYDTSDGTCVRDYVHVADLAAAHLLALESEAVGSLNLGCGRGHSVREVIDVARAVTGKEVSTRLRGRRPGDAPSLVSDPRAAREQLGWEPRHTELSDIVASAWEWRRQHPHGYAR